MSIPFFDCLKAEILYRPDLRDLIEDFSHIYRDELANFLTKEFGVYVSDVTIRNMLEQEKIS